MFVWMGVFSKRRMSFKVPVVTIQPHKLSAINSLDLHFTQCFPLKGSGGQMQTTWPEAGLKAEPPHSMSRVQWPMAQRTLEQPRTVSGTKLNRNWRAEDPPMSFPPRWVSLRKRWAFSTEDTHTSSMRRNWQVPWPKIFFQWRCYRQVEENKFLILEHAIPQRAHYLNFPPLLISPEAE